MLPRTMSSQSPLHIASVLRRRRTPMLVALVSVLVAAGVAAFAWPPTYVSTGTILIEQQEVPIDLVRSTISSYADQRIQVISQRVMTTENLLRIIQKYDLYAKERKTQARERVIAKMHEDVKFKTISADVIDPRQGRPVQATIAFSLSYQSRSPDTAARVANEISSLYLQENLDSRKQLTDQTATFLVEEGDKLQKHISELQEALSDFKEKHLNNLPENSQLNVQLVTRLEEEKRDVDTQIRALDQQLVYLDAQLAQLTKTSPIYTSTGERVMSPADRLKILRTDYAKASAIYSPDHPDVIRLKRQIEGLEAEVDSPGADNDHARQLQDAEAQLAQARQRYAANHPDVQRLERLVASLSVPKNNQGSAGKAAAAAVEQPDNPAYIQIRAQREAQGNELHALEAKRAAIVARQHDMESRLENLPGIEREYTEMAREMDNSQIKYREVRQKQMEAQLAQSLESERKGERFELIEPPLVPEEPASPNRPLILALGAVLSIAIAIGVAMLLEALDHTIRGRGDIESLLQVRPLAVIPWINSAEEIARGKRAMRNAWIVAVGLILAAIPLVHFFYKPLDVLWSVALRRVGG
jgi:uncharacterized protein involved in exopolysaccharide biosynthesis